MLKLLLLILFLLIIFFIFRVKRGMSKIDDIYKAENVKNMEEIKRKIQKRLNDNKINNKKKKNR